MRILFKKRTNLMIVVSVALFSLLSYAAESQDIIQEAFKAVEDNNVAKVKELLQNGLDPKTENKKRWPLLYVARDNDCQEMVTLLIEAGADSAREVELSLVHAQLPQLKILLAGGADPNARDEQDCTPLHRAARSKDPTGVKLLIEKSADPNARDKQGYTPLHRAVDRDCFEVALLLINNGADMCLQSPSGEIPFQVILSWFDDQEKGFFEDDQKPSLESLKKIIKPKINNALLESEMDIPTVLANKITDMLIAP